MSTVPITTTPGEMKTLADVIKRLNTETVGDANTMVKPFIVLPEDRNVHSLKDILDEYLTRPERAAGFARLNTAASFIGHVMRHRSLNETVIFADRDSGRFVAVYDYHKHGTTGHDPEGGPNWCQHGAIYDVQFSPQWEKWQGAEDTSMEGQAFARFLEDRIMDVVAEPMALPSLAALIDVLGGTFGTPAQLMDLSRNLTVNVSTNVKNAFTLSSGELSLAYSETHNDGEGAPLKVPTLFAIGIPVYNGGVGYLLPLRLRYRLSAGRVSWSFTLHRADEALDLDFADAVAAIASGSGITVFAGKPDTTINVPSE